MWVTEQSRRIKVLVIIVSLVIASLIIRLVWMQLLQGPQYKKVADENRIRQIVSQAPRGTIYDKNGAVIVSTRPAFAISVIPSEYTNPEEATVILANILGISSEKIDKLVKEANDNPFTPVRIKRDVDAAIIAKIQERKYYLPGVIVEAIPIRHYVYKELAAHVLGYIGGISEAEYQKRKHQGYSSTDLVGKDGLEKILEEDLRGKDGGLQVEVNAMGEEVQVVGNKPAVPGKGIVLTLDANLQKAAEEALNNQINIARQIGHPAKGGSVIVLDVNAGRILAMASSPSFDPNLFASGISTKDWNKLINDPDFPLTNKAIQNAYPPGSVFKIVTAAAALDMGYTTPKEIFDDRGVYVLNGWSFYGWNTKGLGKLDIAGALSWSSDPAFYELGHRMGIDNLASYALTFGYGKLTGIKLFGEDAGLVPTQQWKTDTYGQEWYPGETLIAAIGQGYYLATPIQQAVLLMAVANGGIMYRPMIVDKILNPDSIIVLEQAQPEVVRTVYLSPEIWDTIRKGLIQVTTEGTGASVFKGMSIPVAGKSGSSETGKGTVHSWFSSYAPADKPAIVVTALVEDGGDGSVSAAPIVRKVIESYFGIASPDLRSVQPKVESD
ncbi:penicillin-binding protein 2 [Dendrosporobacter sp. 1207_IL3150]|uniref:penicillin-binding protein 2 n=1 Tax=Dendrosporobacter sp. 1207_IL3150 TaxID=3084054 RepID=UPI002FDA9A46